MSRPQPIPPPPPPQGPEPPRQPELGEILLLSLSEHDCQRIVNWGRRHQFNFNSPSIGQIVPFVAVALWPGEYPEVPQHGVNGQALIDGEFSLWVTSAKFGPEPGQWSFRGEA